MDGNARVLGVVKRALTEQAIAALETPSGRAPSWLTPVVTRNSVGGLDLYPHSLYWGTPQRAGPKSSDQWCEERSAMETAKCWLAARPALPPEVSAVLASHPAFGIVSEWEAPDCPSTIFPASHAMRISPRRDQFGGLQPTAAGAIMSRRG